ncbi:hypothetical protein GCM10028895_53620 [Pontibacter rugosus]
MNSTSYLVRGLGYIASLEDIKEISIGTYKSIPIRLSDIADVQMSTDLRLGITEENGEGEVVGGIVVMRFGENARDVIARTKVKMEEVAKGLPEGVKFKTAYDRSDLILASINTLTEALWQMILIVCIVVILFLFSFRTGLVAIACILLSVLIGFILMRLFGVTSNIMSLGALPWLLGMWWIPLLLWQRMPTDPLPKGF